MNGSGKCTWGDDHTVRVIDSGTVGCNSVLHGLLGHGLHLEEVLESARHGEKGVNEVVKLGLVYVRGERTASASK